MLVKIDTYYDGQHWCARGMTEDIFTQGATYDELLTNIKEAVALHFEDDVSQGKSVEVLVMSGFEISSVA